MRPNNIAGQKSKTLALQIIRLCRRLKEQHEYEMSGQLIRSATSIGANLTEAEYAQSDADHISKKSIALKEAAETLYWLELLYESDTISKEEYEMNHLLCDEIVRLLVSSINTLKNKH